MDAEQRKQLWLWQVGPLVNLAPRAPDRQEVSLNGMPVTYLRRNKRHYELTFHTSVGTVTLVCREANGYHRLLECDWFPTAATPEQITNIEQHLDYIA